MEPIQPRRLDPEIVEAINDAVDKAFRSSRIAAQSRPQGIEQRQAPAGGIGWTGVGVLVAAVATMIGVDVWQSDSMDARFQDMSARFRDAQTERLAQFGALQAELDAVRFEINALRSETNAKIDALGSETNAEFDAVRFEIGVVRSDIGTLRSETNAKFDALGSEINALRSETNAEFGELRSANSSLEERMLHIENLIEDRWPSAP